MSSFANPAVTIARMFSDSFAGIAPSSVPPFLIAQLVGGAVGCAIVRYLYPSSIPLPNPKERHDHGREVSGQDIYGHRVQSGPAEDAQMQSVEASITRRYLRLPVLGRHRVSGRQTGR
jgi:glycerol uptake facilitator-like aquaporin